jgi:hypothetical protein
VAKFALQEAEWGGGPRATINAIVKIGSTSIPVTFLIDTGSPYTIIVENDLKRTRLPYTAFKKFCRATVGVSMDLKELGEIEIIFRDEAGNGSSFKNKAYAGIISNRDPRLIQFMSFSFLGKDFLDKFNLGTTKRDENGIRHLE